MKQTLLSVVKISCSSSRSGLDLHDDFGLAQPRLKALDLSLEAGILLNQGCEYAPEKPLA